VDPEQLGGLEHVKGGEKVVSEGGDVGGKGRTKDGGEVNHGVDTAMDLIDTRQCLHHLAVVSEIGADEVGPDVRRGTRSKLTTAQSSSIKARRRLVRACRSLR
jgi:hypothetical protein